MVPAVLIRLVLPLGLLVASPGCSSDSDQRDQNYGKDLGVGYRLPDAAVQDAPVVEAQGDQSAQDTGSPGAEDTGDAAPATDTGPGGNTIDGPGNDAPVDAPAADGPDAATDLPVTMEPADGGAGG